MVSSFRSCFSFDFATRCRAGAGLVLGDELLEVLFLRQHARVDAFVLFLAFGLVFTIGLDLPGIHRELAARQFERMVAGRAEKRPIVRDDQAGLCHNS